MATTTASATIDAVRAALAELRTANPLLARPRPRPAARRHRLQKVLVANRGEIAKRFFFALKEEGIGSVAIVTDPDRRQSWYEFADEVVFIGDARHYISIPVVLGAVLLSGADAVYPGYGFLSEEARLVEGLEAVAHAEGRELVFMGPPADVMRRVGAKLDARALARAHGVPLLEGTEILAGLDEARAEAARLGYPVMVKLNAGGGGKGMNAVHAETELAHAWESARRVGQAQYGDDSVYLERYIESPVHVEVQIFNGMAVGLRQCAVQRRNQKIVEESADYFLEHRTVLKLLAAAEAMAEASGYGDSGGGAGTVEFLLDAASDRFGFLEVNARLQVEYPVTDQSLHIDLVKWQILHFDGRAREIPYDDVLRARFAEKDHTIECRIYAEDPWNHYAPSPGVIRDLDLPTFNGIRCDFGFKKGDTILPHYDPMVGKLIAHARTRGECLLRLERALGEVYVRGITTNVDQLLKIVRHPQFRAGTYTNRLLDETPELQSGESDAERPVDAAVFAALAELVRAVHEALEESLASGDLESILAAGALHVVPAFHAEVHGLRLRIDFLQLGLERWACWVNGVHYGEMDITRQIESDDDARILFRGRSHPVRIDRRPAGHVLRVMEEDGIRYYRVRLTAVGRGRAVDPPGAVRTPFQGSFVTVRPGRDGRPLGLGSRVERGDPLVVVEAMKMETVLDAPVSGVISYLLEDGDLARLVRGTTSQGLVIGKPLAEGELLVVVDDGGDRSSPEPAVTPIEVEPVPDEILGALRAAAGGDPGLADAVRADAPSALPRVLELVRASLLGYVHDDDLARGLEQALAAVPDAPLPADGTERMVAEIFDVYALLKQIYSPALGANQTWFSEMNRLVLAWDDETYTPPEFFRSVLGALLERYGLAWSGGARTSSMRLALFHVMRGWAAIHDGRPLVGALLALCRTHGLTAPRVRAAAARLVQQEQPERDDDLAVLGRALLAGAAGVGRRADVREDLDPGRAARDGGDAFRARAVAALAAPEPDLVPAALPEWVRRELGERVRRWSSRDRVDRLPSPLDPVVVYRKTPLGGGTHAWAIIAWLPDGEPVAADSLARALDAAGRVLALWDALDHGEDNVVDVLACERPVRLADTGDGVLRHDDLRSAAERVAALVGGDHAAWVLVEIDDVRPGAARSERRIVSLASRPGRVVLDLVQETDQRTPVWSGVVDERLQRLFDRGKWPLEVWVREAFDPGSAREILIASIDGAESEAADAGARRSVGAAIYEGCIDGRPAVFFLKDSRVSGGATGDLEGRKYLAACYYAYLRDTPLYVWNDGAGANIRQGMVALNRAAEGFMFNALVANGVDYRRFLSTVQSAEDPVVRDLAAELDRRFALGDLAAARRGPRAFVMTAVGVGSSSGLDVYGSAQAAIQLMLDAEESYRVLTGANVIRAVTGERLTNYEIGGAKVMGPWTGTVDLVARDRLDLLARVRAIHALFARDGHPPGILRAPHPAVETRSPGAALSEDAISANVDDGRFLSFKGEWVEAGGLVGGFARLGGKPVLVMGPRTHVGIRSFASVVRARELLQIANKTRAPKILVLGTKWYRGLGDEDEMALRARADFVRLLFAPGTPRVSIVTHPDGLRLVTLNSAADGVVYVRRPEDSDAERRLAARAPTFQAASLAQAFDLTNRLLDLLDEDRQPFAFRAPARYPAIPAEASRPFDMVGDVITTLVDDESFLEYHAEGRVGGGSTLVTGLATLEGHVVGIIADQPLAGGAPDAPGTEKFRAFVELLERNRVPLVMLSNAPGFVPGTKQERLRIQQIGGWSLDVNVLSRIPVVSVVLNQNFGGRQIHAFSRLLRPGVAAIALDRATVAVMGGHAAFDLFHGVRHQELLAKGRRAEADRLRNEFLAEFRRKSRADADALDSGALDWTVADLADLRAHTVRAMALARRKAAAWQKA